ncbi:hypothetical protein [Nitrospira lenta]|uniref:Uncharacterized protein n=1 Tax=Nitrospira lenta TaxID=1436998 RepID=A0A330L9Z1_9BACT|nr:hypothetical protein [Nitrospira lenta]SPP66882.1 hypothetical protein NITLEN_90137 [Nitrospira lenta]
MTVVGRVMDQHRLGIEPVLARLYVRGWGMSGEHDELWEQVDPNYIPSFKKSGCPVAAADSLLSAAAFQRRFGCRFPCEH